ncbi:MAG TPA: ABC transporter substrate-binding protein [Candidatus Binatia bacterium]|nr:ABC transporter substrate-binding protein [Candidatus Binatia bacterium]
MCKRFHRLVFSTLCWLVIATAAWAAEAPKRGGILNATLIEAPPSFSIHEEVTISTVWPMMSCYNNLVLFDPLKKQESLETIIPELAEKWTLQDGGKSLVFFLRRDVKWHDGQPFTSKDVKHTFDTVREAPGITGKLRVNPRQLWYENVESIDTPDAQTVVFRLKRPQASLLLMLASGYAPIYPAHIPVAELRSKCVGTGPFKLKEYRQGELIEMVRNPDYFIKGRPYLDGIRYTIIKDRSTRYAALQAGRVDIPFIWEVAKTPAETAKKALPKLVMSESSTNVNDHILVNLTKPIFKDPKMRLAITLAVDRPGYVQAGRQGAAVLGGVMLPRPYGVWGLPEAEQKKIPGFGDPVKQKAESKKLLAELGYGASKPLKITVSTRAIPIYVDIAGYVMDQFRQVGIESTLEQVETGVWHAKMTRREFDVAVNTTGIGPDDPDANLYENFKCGSARNYSAYCSEEVDRLIDQQSQIIERDKRLKLVNELDKRLQLDGARMMLGWSKEYVVQWPYVKNIVPHQSIYNYGRMQEVWLDK